jgi:anaerobic magnesium-protoporphyrin IX monomethyl ester cyclase
MTNVLLIYPALSEDPRNVFPAAFFPTGLGIVASVLEQHGASVRVLDAHVASLDRGEMTLRLEEALGEADWVGISALANGFRYVRWLSRQIKAVRPEVPVVLGGPICSHLLDILAAHTSCDVFCVGEGEKTVVELTETLARRGELSSVRGIGYRDAAGQLVVNEPRAWIADLDTLPQPAYHLLDVGTYAKRARIVKQNRLSMNIIGSRGCPYRCTFCAPSFGGRLRLRSLEAVLDEIEYLATQFAIRHIDFLDELFFSSEERVVASCTALMQGKREITWSGNARVNLFHRFDAATVKLVRKSGCRRITFGFESGSQAMLDSMQKQTTVEQMQRSIDLCRAEGIDVGGNFILGMPGETEESLDETYRFMYENRLRPSFTFACPYPGSALYEEAKARGLIEDEAAFLDSLASYFELNVVLCDLPRDRLLEAREEMTRALTRRREEPPPGRWHRLLSLFGARRAVELSAPRQGQAHVDKRTTDNAGGQLQR